MNLKDTRAGGQISATALVAAAEGVERAQPAMPTTGDFPPVFGHGGFTVTSDDPDVFWGKITVAYRPSIIDPYQYGFDEYTPKEDGTWVLTAGGRSCNGQNNWAFPPPGEDANVGSYRRMKRAKINPDLFEMLPGGPNGGGEDGWFSPGFGVPLGLYGLLPGEDPVFAAGQLAYNLTSYKVALLTQPGYYKIWVGYHGALYPWSRTFNTFTGTYGPNTSNTWGELRCGFEAGAGDQQWFHVCTGTHQYFPSGSGAQSSVPGSGGGVLLAAINVRTMPHEIRVRSVVQSILDPFMAADGASGFRSFFTITGFVAERVPMIYRQGPYGTWTPLGVTPPSPPLVPPPTSPVATDDSYTVQAGGSLTVPPPGVLGNDTVPAGYTAVLDTSPAYGDLVYFNPDGSFFYKQTATGIHPPITDTFTYHLTNAAGTVSNTATVSITILDPGIDPGPGSGGGSIVDTDTGGVSPPPAPSSGGGSG